MKNSGKIVIKIGTNVITDEAGVLDLKIVENIARQIAEAKNGGKKIIIVTSGAIGAGMGELGLKSRPDNILMRQVCAAVGQGILMAKYHGIFGKYGMKVAQVLITYDTLADKSTSGNMGSSINRMLEIGIIPIVNENDAIAVEEIGKSFGDNDMMSAKLAIQVKADLLIILTDVDGLYDKNPKEKSASLVENVSKINEKLFSTSGKSRLGVGGMKSKVEAAKLATDEHVKVIIANGKKENTLARLIKGEKEGTLFLPKQ